MTAIAGHAAYRRHIVVLQAVLILHDTSSIQQSLQKKNDMACEMDVWPIKIFGMLHSNFLNPMWDPTYFAAL